jgi:hypothetical protein
MSSSHTKQDEYEPMLNSLFKCNVIYSKEYQHGTLFGLEFSKQTYVSKMHKEIVYLDDQMRRNGPTKFTSICDTLSGKIKSFGSDGEHSVDEHHKAIFATHGAYAGGNEATVHSDVRIWYPNGVQRVATVEEDADDSEDEASDEKEPYQMSSSEEGGGKAKLSKQMKGTVEDEIREESTKTVSF